MLNNLLIATIVSAILSAAGTWSILNTRHDLEITKLENTAWQAHVDGLNTKNEIELYNNKISQQQSEIEALKTVKRETVTRYINKEVIKYVQADNAGKCILPYEWVRIHDTAATGNIAGDTNSTAKSNDTAASVTDIEALGVVTENYQMCNIIRDRLIGLQAWAKNIK